MRYNKIRKMDISDGPGVRVSIFLQGCPFHCEGCFNESTWDYKLGTPFTNDTIETVLELCKEDYIEGLSILGGEPLYGVNIEATTMLAKAFKEKFPNKTLWVWTGNTYEEIKSLDVFNYIDVLVDGRFILSLKNPMLRFCGSSNQRVIDIKKTRKNKKIVLYEKTFKD